MAPATGPVADASGAVPAHVEAGATRLVVSHVTRTFPGVRAVDDVSFAVPAGEIHALVGENGAGKSTLMHLIAGVYRPDTGEILLDGRAITELDERGAAEAGVAMVFQERSLVGALSVAENVFAGRQPTDALGIIRRGRMESETRRILGELETDISPTATVDRLSPGQQQMVEIAKALSHELKVLILDEPTSSLTIGEARHLFRVLRRLAAAGVAVIYVSHRLSEVFEIATRVTVLKDGRVTGERVTSEVGERDLITLMVGRDLSLDPDARRTAPDAPVVLEVRGLSADPVSDVSFSVRAGEIVCLAGLVGAGRTEVCEAIFGARRIQHGTILIDGREHRPRSPGDSMAAGVSMVPEDRKEAGLFVDFDITANMAAADLGRFTRGGLLSMPAMEQQADRYVRDLRIATPDVHREVRSLSGGNQQKVLLARWLLREPRLLIVDEPTRGVDVGSKSDIYAILRELAGRGIALLVVSSDLPEVLALAHRVVVMAGGRVAGEMDGAAASELAILHMAAPQGRSASQGAA